MDGERDINQKISLMKKKKKKKDRKEAERKFINKVDFGVTHSGSDYDQFFEIKLSIRIQFERYKFVYGGIGDIICNRMNNRFERQL